MLKKVEDELYSIALRVPNLPDDEVPEGEDENDNIELKRVLTPASSLTCAPKEHWEISDGWIDFQRGVKLSKSRFSVLVNEGAK